MQDITYSEIADDFQSKQSKSLLSVCVCVCVCIKSFFILSVWKLEVLGFSEDEPSNQSLFFVQGTSGHVPEYMLHDYSKEGRQPLSL